MKKLRIGYSGTRLISPVKFWVHKKLHNESPEKKEPLYDPPLPGKVHGKGFPYFTISYRGHDLLFTSVDEIEHCIDVLSQKVLPTTKQLAEKSGFPSYQHLHWLTKWPGNIKSWKDRQEIIKLLEKLKLLISEHLK